MENIYIYHSPEKDLMITPRNNATPSQCVDQTRCWSMSLTVLFGHRYPNVGAFDTSPEWDPVNRPTGPRPPATGVARPYSELAGHCWGGCQRLTLPPHHRTERSPWPVGPRETGWTRAAKARAREMTHFVYVLPDIWRGRGHINSPRQVGG